MALFWLLQDRTKSGRVSKVQWANGLNLVLQLDVPFLSYVVSEHILLLNTIPPILLFKIRQHPNPDTGIPGIIPPILLFKTG